MDWWKKKKAASSDCSNIHNNGEQHKENKIKESSSSVMYSIWSIWDYSSESFHSSFSFKAFWWTISSFLESSLFKKFPFKIWPALRFLSMLTMEM